MKVHIYAIKNLINNKMYIGSTKSIKSRQYSHFRLLKLNKHHSPHLQYSYNKYGKDKFSFYTLEECTSDNRKERELYYIKHYNSFNKTGYNVYEPDGSKFKCSDSTKDKLIKTNIRMKKSKKVKVYSLLGVLLNTFESINICAKNLEISSGLVSALISGKRKSYKGMVILLEEVEFNYKPSPMSRDMTKFYSSNK